MSNSNVTTQTLSWLALVQKAWGAQWNVPEKVYEFSNSRTFESTDNSTSGIYKKT